MFKKAIKILSLKIGLISNKEELLPVVPLNVEYKSLLTDFNKVEEIDFSEKLDSYIVIIDDENLSPQIIFSSERIFASGPFLKLTNEAEDLRFSIFGNEGLFFRYVLVLLEEKYGIYSFHACSLYDENNNRLFIGCGSKGSGKTCLILRGLELGFKLFSAEMTHFCFENNSLKFFKGALVDNIRIGNLKYNFPKILKRLAINIPEIQDEWEKKIAVDLSQFETYFDELKDPEIIVFFPHIEEVKEKAQLSDLSDKKRTILKLLFENASEKIGEEFLLYESIPISGIDNEDAQKNRFEAIKNFLDKGRITRILKIVAGARNCWEGII
jgi:hypothetical protein